jgi:hypothetical protein
MEEIMEGDGIVTGTVIEVVKGGLVVDIGVRAFLPASLVAERRVQDLEPYLGRQIRAKLIEVDRVRNNVVISRRALMERSDTETSARETTSTANLHVKVGLADQPSPMQAADAMWSVAQVVDLAYRLVALEQGTEPSEPPVIREVFLGSLSVSMDVADVPAKLVGALVGGRDSYVQRSDRDRGAKASADIAEMSADIARAEATAKTDELDAQRDLVRAQAEKVRAEAEEIRAKALLTRASVLKEVVALAGMQLTTEQIASVLLPQDLTALAMWESTYVSARLGDRPEAGRAGKWRARASPVGATPRGIVVGRRR